MFKNALRACFLNIFAPILKIATLRIKPASLAGQTATFYPPFPSPARKKQGRGSLLSPVDVGFYLLK